MAEPLPWKWILPSAFAGGLIATCLMLAVQSKPEQTAPTTKPTSPLARANDNEGITLLVPAPNTCGVIVTRTEFSKGQTRFYVNCADGKTEYKNGVETNIALNNDPRLNPDKYSRVSVVLMPPSEIPTPTR